MSDPRAYTKQEIIDMLMDNFRSIADYWATVQLGPEHEIKTPEEDIKYRCEGVVFTMLSTLDGSSMNIPGIDLVICSTPEDVEYYKESGENWFEPEMRINTALHEHFHK